MTTLPPLWPLFAAAGTLAPPHDLTQLQSLVLAHSPDVAADQTESTHWTDCHWLLTQLRMDQLSVSHPLGRQASRRHAELLDHVPPCHPVHDTDSHLWFCHTMTLCPCHAAPVPQAQVRDAPSCHSQLSICQALPQALPSLPCQLAAALDELIDQDH